MRKKKLELPQQDKKLHIDKLPMKKNYLKKMSGGGFVGGADGLATALDPQPNHKGKYRSTFKPTNYKVSQESVSRNFKRNEPEIQGPQGQDRDYQKKIVANPSDKIRKLHGGKESYNQFVREINKELFMKNYKGKGKRTAQSLLYELKKDLVAEKGKEGDNFFYKVVNDLNKFVEENTPPNTLDLLTNLLKEVRKDVPWCDKKYKKSRKLKKLDKKKEELPEITDISQLTN